MNRKRLYRLAAADAARSRTAPPAPKPKRKRRKLIQIIAALAEAAKR